MFRFLPTALLRAKTSGVIQALAIQPRSGSRAITSARSGLFIGKRPLGHGFRRLPAISHVLIPSLGIPCLPRLHLDLLPYVPLKLLAFTNRLWRVLLLYGPLPIDMSSIERLRRFRRLQMPAPPRQRNIDPRPVKQFPFFPWRLA